jgi:hypothetical protein
MATAEMSKRNEGETMQADINVTGWKCKSAVGISEGQRPLSTRIRWKNNTEQTLKKQRVIPTGLVWKQYAALLSTVMSFRVSRNAAIFMSS